MQKELKRYNTVLPNVRGLYTSIKHVLANNIKNGSMLVLYNSNFKH